MSNKTKSLYSNNGNNNNKSTQAKVSNHTDLFTKKPADKMTISELQTSAAKYDEQIEQKQGNIINKLKETKQLSNAIGNELNSNTEALERIDDGLDEIDYKLTTSEYLVKRLSSMFSYFRTVKQSEPYVKKQNLSNDKTQFVETNFEIKSDTIGTEANKLKKESAFYDDVSLFLDELQKDSNAFGKILKEHHEQIETINTKVEKSDGRIKKTITKVKI